MRIALITREYPPETPWGGIAAFYRQLAMALREHGHEVEVFAQGIYHEHTDDLDGVLVHRVLARNNVTGELTGGDVAGNSDLGDFAFSLAQEFLRAFLCRNRVAPFDLVEGHEHLGVNALINLYAPASVITVTRSHTAYHSLVRRHLVDWPVSPRIEALERLSLVQANHRIATSDFIDAITREDFGLDHPAPVLPNFIAPPTPPTGAETPRENLLAFAGRLVLEHKRPDLAARAFARLAPEFPDWRIEFAGPDMILPDGTTTWQICAAALAECDAVRFRYDGVLDAGEMDRLYRRARLLIVPSKFESFGMVAIEAMHRGCVPVVADQTALVDAVGDADLQFRNGDLENLVARLRTLMGDGELWQTKSAACRHRAASTFNHDYLLKQNLYFFDSVRQVRRSAASATPKDQERPLPFISVVTPSFNHGRFIEETIASVLYQDYPRCEHIVMDAGSNDETLRILRKYPHLRWVSEPDLGQTHAINKGLLEARGDIVAYLNSDDVYRAGAFHAVARFFQENPAAQILVGHCDLIDGESKITGGLRAKAGTLSDLVRYWRWGDLFCLPQQSVFFRRSLLAEIGLFDVRFHMAMDYNYWLRAVTKYRFHVVDQTLAAFRITPSTKTGARTDEMYLEEYQASREFWGRLPLRQRVRAAYGARRQVARKMVDLSEHLLLRTTQGRRPLQLLGIASRYWPPACLGPRFVLTLAGAVAKGPNRLSAGLTQMHFGYLEFLWRHRRKHPAHLAPIS